MQEGKHPGIGGRRRHRFTIEVLIDVVTALLLLIAGVLLMTLGPGIQHKREYWPDDHLNTHTYAVQETVPPWLGFIFAGLTVIAPLICELCYNDQWSIKGRRVALYIIALFISFSACFFIVESLKIAVARPRPDYYTRCQIKEVSGATPDNPHQPLFTDECTTDDDDRNVSFPSAHSAYTIWGGGICFFYLASIFEVFDRSKDVEYRFSKVVLCFLTLVPGIFTAISRTFDYRHYPSDVVVGGIIGFGFGFAGVFLFKTYLDHWRGLKIRSGISGEEEVCYASPDVIVEV